MIGTKVTILIGGSTGGSHFRGNDDHGDEEALFLV